MLEVGINLYAQVVEIAFPIAVAFAVGDLLVASFLKMAFRGRIEF